MIHLADDTSELAVRPRPPCKQAPPALILGGEVNALSVARSLHRQGVEVYAVGPHSSPARHSRCCKWMPVDASGHPYGVWSDFLLSQQTAHLQGAVLLAASDDAVEIVARHRDVLQTRYLLDDLNPEAQLCFLNKRLTYHAADQAGLRTPRFWIPEDLEAVHRLRPELVYPLIIKPERTHRFQQRFGHKFLVAENFDSLVAAYRSMRDDGFAAILVEKIPGGPQGNEQLFSYYTYMTGDGQPLFDFTKRVLRRWPLNMGNGTYHIAGPVDELAELRELALRLFRHVGARGLVNVEFIRDMRDGNFKLIECNPRFSAANCILEKCGLDLARLSYARAAGLPDPPLRSSRRTARLWYPVDDVQAFLMLRRQGKLTAREWLTSILHPATLPLFQWNDSWPAVIRVCQKLNRGWNRFVKRGWFSLPRPPYPKATSPSASLPTGK